jgi:hypothetical protein
MENINGSLVFQILFHASDAFQSNLHQPKRLFGVQQRSSNNQWITGAVTTMPINQCRRNTIQLNAHVRMTTAPRQWAIYFITDIKRAKV